jgi:hypothetical protein
VTFEESTVDEAITESNPLRRNVSLVLVAALVIALVAAAVARSNDDSTEAPDAAGLASVTSVAVSTSTEPRPPDQVAATIVFENGSTAEVLRFDVERLTSLVLSHPEFMALSFELPSEQRVRTRVTRNLVMAEIARVASPEPVDREVFELVRAEQIEQVHFELLFLDELDPGSRSIEIIREVQPYVDVLAETVARRGRISNMNDFVQTVSVFVDSEIGVWDPVAVDVFG